MNISRHSSTILRIGIALVFLYFGIQQIQNPDIWALYVPESVTTQWFSANNLVIANGILEITLGTFLLIGLYTKASSLILAIHLFFITISLGLTPTAVRDFGLSIATLTIFFNGPDNISLDTYLGELRTLHRYASKRNNT